jgi:hypothetical protein
MDGAHTLKDAAAHDPGVLLAALITGAFAFSRELVLENGRRERVLLALSFGFVTFLLTAFMGSWATAFLWS